MEEGQQARRIVATIRNPYPPLPGGQVLGLQAAPRVTAGKSDGLTDLGPAE